jgi:hypothetical protein
MSVYVDEEPLDAVSLRLTTVGQLLDHVTGQDRLVVSLLLDGQEPDFSNLAELRSRSIMDATLYLETTCPSQLANDALDAIDESVSQADDLRSAAAEAFRGGDASGALGKLAGCFSLWQTAHDSIGKTAKLLDTDLGGLTTNSGQSVLAVLESFAEQLRQLKSALESRDYVLCCDVLTYDMEGFRPDFESATNSLRVLAR